jgi:hypothetical protein
LKLVLSFKSTGRTWQSDVDTFGRSHIEKFKHVASPYPWQRTIWEAMSAWPVEWDDPTYEVVLHVTDDVLSIRIERNPE